MSKLIKKYLGGLVIYNSPRDVELHLEKDLPTTPEMLSDYERSLKRLRLLNSPEEPMDATIRLLSNGMSTYKPTALLMLRDMHGKKELSFSDYLGLAPIVLPTVVAAGAVIPEAAAAATNLGFWGELLKDIGTYYVGDKVSEKLTGKGIGTHINDDFGLEDEHPVGELVGFSAASPIRKVATKAVESAAKLMSPKYALSKAIDETPLNVAMLNSYNLSAPLPRYLFSDWLTIKGAHPFSYQAGHIHDIDLEDLGRILSRYGYFDNPKQGHFVIETTLPDGKRIVFSPVETLPINFPAQISSNPELPIATWGKRGNRTDPDRVIPLSNVSKNSKNTTNRVKIFGNVTPSGDIGIVSAIAEAPYKSKTISKLLSDLNSENPSPNIAGRINAARKFWDTHALVEDATPARDPFKKGAKKQYISHTFSSTPVSPSRTTHTSLWSSGKLEMINYIKGPTHKERLMTNLGLTEEGADAYIELELRNLENVELVNLGPYKVGRPFGSTIGYAVDRRSGPYFFPEIKANSDWMPNSWSELLYENFLSLYEKQYRTYNLAKQGVTQVGIAEGLLPYKANVGFHEAGHATTRGGMDPALLPIIDYDTKLASPLLGLNPAMLDPLEARQFGIELDKAWEALQGHLPEYYLRLSPSALRRLFFYDILRASDDAGERFYLSVPKEWALKFDPKYNYDINRGANGLDPDEALYDFWDKFVYNNYGNNNTT